MKREIKKCFGVFLMFLIVVSTVCLYNYLYAQENVDITNLERVQVILDEGFKYLQADSLASAKIKFEEALEIAPEKMRGEIKKLIDSIDSAIAKREGLAAGVLGKSEEEAKRISELQQNILQFEREQKKLTYMTQGNSYYNQGEYEKAIAEFNKILAIYPQDRDAISSIEKTNLAIKKAQKVEAKKIQDYWENAKSFARSKKYDKAIEELEKLLAVSPAAGRETLEYIEEINLYKAQMNEYKRLQDIVDKGKERLKDKEYDEAIELWRQVLKEKKDYPEAELLIAEAEFNKAKDEGKIVEGKYKAAREEKMLEIDKAFVPIIGGSEKEVKKQVEVDEELLAIEKIKTILKDKKVTLEFIDADLRGVIIFLSRQSGVNMMVDEAIFQAVTAPAAGMAAAGPDMRGAPGLAAETAATAVTTYNVTASLSNMPLSDALALILRPRGLDYEIYPNVVWISSQDRIANVPIETLETRIFDLQFGGPFRGQIRPEPLQLETITFGEGGG